MNTFLPYASFEASALCLDDKRLGKQRLEAKQILETLLGRSQGWENHPCTKMWRGHEYWLAAYGLAMCDEWIRRGFQDTLFHYFYHEQRILPKKIAFIWDESLYSSMRANLVRKDYKRYKILLGFKEEPRDGYDWPV